MARSKLALQTLDAEKGAKLSANDLARLATGDPFLCLCLLREAENRRSSRLGHETSTPLAALLSEIRELMLWHFAPELSQAALDALPDDLAVARKLIPYASMEWLVGELKWVPEEMHMNLVDRANVAFQSAKQDIP